MGRLGGSTKSSRPRFSHSCSKTDLNSLPPSSCRPERRFDQELVEQRFGGRRAPPPVASGRVIGCEPRLAGGLLVRLGRAGGPDRYALRIEGGPCPCQADLSLGGRDLVVSRHGCYRVEYAVASHECMEERRRDMQQDQSKEHESKVEVRVPKQRMQAVALRQDRRKARAG
jgi:hypothetical protein